MRKFKALESLRFFAAISVALLHIFGIYGKGNLIPYSFILSVDFFFVLSGFSFSFFIFHSGRNFYHKFIVPHFFYFSKFFQKNFIIN